MNKYDVIDAQHDIVHIIQSMKSLEMHEDAKKFENLLHMISNRGHEKDIIEMLPSLLRSVSSIVDLLF